MNKRRFIERLNLYLDDELSEEESDKLLDSVRKNPEYHRIYMQYCQIHNACSQLGAPFAEERPKQGWRQKVYAVSGMAAAVALLGLAAQNLAPMLETQNGQQNFEAQLGQSTTQMPEETFVVLDVNALDGTRLMVNSFEVESFDLEKAFEVNESLVRSPRSVEFASFSAPKFTEAKPSVSKAMSDFREEFSFGEAMDSSAYEHEMLVAEGDLFNAFSDVTPSSIVESENEVRFDFGRAASYRGAADDIRAAAVSE